MASTSNPAIVPFDPPEILQAKRRTGIVNLPEAATLTSSSSTAKPNPLDLSWNASWSRDDDATFPPSLQRRSSLNGNILQIGNIASSGDGSLLQSYFMQRKIGKTPFGSVRVGFVLVNDEIPEEGGEDDMDSSGFMTTEYNVAKSNGPYPFEMVAIKVYDKKQWTAYETELSALQIMSACNNGGGFVEYSHVVGSDQRDNVYVIVPFHGEGTLFQYVAECGTLSEPVARHYFLQILKAIQTLQSQNLCHRNISLDNIHLRGTDCTLTELGSCLRLSGASSLPPHYATGANPHYICPEVIRTESFAPQAADLWAAGICLSKLLLGMDLFVWASEQDKRFVQISVEGNLRQRVLSAKVALSEDALDLLQGMLHAKPSDRLTLDQCLQHAWLQGETMAPQFPTPAFADS